MAPHQQRVVEEKADLDVKCEKLEAFEKTPIFDSLPKQEQERLMRQLQAMLLYSSILGERIENF